MSKNILVLGAGMVSRPLIRYLLEKTNNCITVATRTLSKAEEIIDKHPRGKAIELKVSNITKLKKLISESDLTVSLLPYIYHERIAKICIKHSRPMVTTSYVSHEMKLLHKEANEAEVLILNECGLDPGIDHMSAMRIIHKVESKDGKILSFRSSTGALPSHEANTNPFGYKFSWAPKGVLLASRNPSRWLQDGNIISITGEKLFENYFLQDIPGLGTFENYPNRDSIPYKEIYGIKDAKTVYRGTLRMTGWCETMNKIVQLGWLDNEPLNDFKGNTYGDLTRYLIKEEHKDGVKDKIANFLGLEKYAAVIKRLEWLGLLSDMPLPPNKNNPLDYLNFLTLQKMKLENNEKDMIVMHHEFVVKYPKKREYITSTLVNYGIPNGDSAVSKTVSLPAAIAVKLILSGEICIKGVRIPVLQEIYNPILNELEEFGLKFNEKNITVDS
jgi:saccharopine dehydrogenase-like NADP-dependent oxidoreductase